LKVSRKARYHLRTDGSERKNPADDILYDRYSESQFDLLGDTRAAPPWIALPSYRERHELNPGLDLFGPGLRRLFGENSSRYFTLNKARWKFNRVDGLQSTADRQRRFGLIHTETDPR